MYILPFGQVVLPTEARLPPQGSHFLMALKHKQFVQFKELRDTPGAHRGRNGAAVSGGIMDSSATQQTPGNE